jgi:energy-coupling factor transport system ATP-binding protein
VTGVQTCALPISESPEKLELDFEPLREWDRRLAVEQSAISPVIAPNTEEITAGLEVRNLTFRYLGQETEALKDISFSVASGECVALVGRNGSGKSTMAKCICGFVKPDAGSISYNGKDLADLSIMERAEKIGYVMQNPNQMISFPMIYDETAFALRTRGIPEADVKATVHEALKVCGLYPFRNWPVNALSYGQKKRLTIAAILALRPSFMILDEPTAGQDYRHYTEFMEFLLGLNSSRKISLLLITHDMHLMLEYTSRAVVLSEGVCVADQEPFQVLTDDGIIEKASLKRTSLYDLALKAGLPDPRGFVGRHIAHDRRNKK